MFKRSLLSAALTCLAFGPITAFASSESEPVLDEEDIKPLMWAQPGSKTKKKRWRDFTARERAVVDRHIQRHQANFIYSHGECNFCKWYKNHVKESLLPSQFLSYYKNSRHWE